MTRKSALGHRPARTAHHPVDECPRCDPIHHLAPLFRQDARVEESPLPQLTSNGVEFASLVIPGSRPRLRGRVDLVRIVPRQAPFPCQFEQGIIFIEQAIFGLRTGIALFFFALGTTRTPPSSVTSIAATRPCHFPPINYRTMPASPVLMVKRSPSALTQTEGTGIWASFSKIALAEVVHTNGRQSLLWESM